MYEPSKDVRYACSKCNKERAKLWRRAGNADGRKILTCLACTSHQAGLIGLSVDAKGEYVDRSTGKNTNYIGRYVPAIPEPKGSDLFFIHEAPPEALKWWQSLPLR